MRKERDKAKKLRLAGHSYSEISEKLKVPKSTLSGWFSNLTISKKLKEKIYEKGKKKSITGLIKRNKQQTTDAVQRAINTRREAAKEITTISHQNLFFLGPALYWAEGYKRPVIRNGREVTYHVISLTNTDPELIKIFIKFLNECLDVPLIKIKAGLRIFPHQNEKEIKKYWHTATKIPVINFQKTYFGISKSSKGIRPYNRLPYGILQIVVADTPLFHKILGSIEGIKKFV